HIRVIKFNWIGKTHTPLAVRVEYSDDKNTWALSAIFQIEQRNPEGRTETLILPQSGRHRYWRLRAEAGENAGFFAIRRLNLSETVPVSKKAAGVDSLR